MTYLSKGILPWKSSEGAVSVSHRGALHKLTGDQAALWLAGQYQPGYTETSEQDTELAKLADVGIAEFIKEEDETAVFRLLTNCIICPVRVKTRITLLNRDERRLWRWISRAGLRLTMAELTLLAERGVKPAQNMMGEENRQALTEAIYTAETISDGILESLMEKSPARGNTVKAVLGLLRKQKIYLI